MVYKGYTLFWRTPFLKNPGEESTGKSKDTSVCQHNNTTARFSWSTGLKVVWKHSSLSPRTQVLCVCVLALRHAVIDGFFPHRTKMGGVHFRSKTPTKIKIKRETGGSGDVNLWVFLNNSLRHIMSYINNTQTLKTQQKELKRHKCTDDDRNLGGWDLCSNISYNRWRG